MDDFSVGLTINRYARSWRTDTDALDGFWLLEGKVGVKIEAEASDLSVAYYLKEDARLICFQRPRAARPWL